MCGALFTKRTAPQPVLNRQASASLPPSGSTFAPTPNFCSSAMSVSFTPMAMGNFPRASQSASCRSSRVSVRSCLSKARTNSSPSCPAHRAMRPLPAPSTLGSLMAILPFHFGSNRSLMLFKSFSETNSRLIKTAEPGFFVEHFGKNEKRPDRVQFSRLFRGNIETRGASHIDIPKILTRLTLFGKSCGKVHRSKTLKLKRDLGVLFFETAHDVAIGRARRPGHGNFPLFLGIYQNFVPLCFPVLALRAPSCDQGHHEQQDHTMQARPGHMVLLFHFTRGFLFNPFALTVLATPPDEKSNPPRKRTSATNALLVRRDDRVCPLWRRLTTARDRQTRHSRLA